MQLTNSQLDGNFGILLIFKSFFVQIALIVYF